VAIAAGVLADDPSIEDLVRARREFRKGDDDIPLQYKEAKKESFIFPKCSIQHRLKEEAPMSTWAFLNIHAHNLRNAGYIFGASLNTIRRAVGAAINSESSAPPRAKHVASHR
jgi:hypothetical protein